MAATTKESLHGLRVVSFESRRAKEMAELIRRYGGEPIVAPSMREVPLSENRAAIELLPEIEAGKFDLIILMTGVGTRTLHQVLRTEYSQERILSALRQVRLVARGPKPVAALKELGLGPTITVAEPNTWREVLAALDVEAPIGGKRIAVQEYGVPNAELVAGLEQRGASVKTIAIYRWALPEDLAPLRNAVDSMLRGEAQVALFTNGAQVEHLFRVAAEQKMDDKLRLACMNMAIASVGPICTQVLQKFGLKPDIEPEHPKMGSLIAEVAASASGILAAKSARRS
jgi:uroporphyrinogen-III synthase